MRRTHTENAPCKERLLDAASAATCNADQAASVDAACDVRHLHDAQTRTCNPKPVGNRTPSLDQMLGCQPAPHTATKKAATIANLPLVVGVSTRALFDCEEEHRVFIQQGEAAYYAFQREREATALQPGCAFELVKRLLALNSPKGPKLVNVVLLSRNAPDQALRIFDACEAHGLAISGGSFTSGRPTAAYAEAWGVDLFLSNNGEDVRAALAAGIAAARLAPVTPTPSRTDPDEVCIALDGDGVAFGSESESIFRDRGVTAFERYEQANAYMPLNPGPFGRTFLRKLLALRRLTQRPDGARRVRIALVTARNAPAHERAIRTLRVWGALFDEAHFVGNRGKAPFLIATGALAFFDDCTAHVEAASRTVASGHVPEITSQPQREPVGARSSSVRPGCAEIEGEG